MPACESAIFDPAIFDPGSSASMEASRWSGGDRRAVRQMRTHRSGRFSAGAWGTYDNGSDACGRDDVSCLVVKDVTGDDRSAGFWRAVGVDGLELGLRADEDGNLLKKPMSDDPLGDRFRAWQAGPWCWKRMLVLAIVILSMLLFPL